MPIDQRTLKLVAGMRLSLDTTVNKASADLVVAWGQAWPEVAGEWEQALSELVAGSKDGAWPTRAQLRRATQAQRALKITRDALDQLATDSGVRVVQDVPTLTTEAAQWEARLIASQLPASAGTQADLVASFARVDPAALQAIVTRATTRVTALSQPLSAQAEAAMKSTLIRGVALGDNPRKAAATMLDRVHGAFDGGRNRALVVARTELIDAHRAAAYAQDQANPDTLTGWVWTATLDARTCPSCWAKHGTVHDVTEVGPEDHQQGRCARVPKAQSWTDLGFDIEEPPDLLPDARTAFDSLPAADQEKVMGKARLGLLKSGRIDWDDLTVKRTTTGWRDSWAPRPTADLLKLAS